MYDISASNVNINRYHRTWFTSDHSLPRKYRAYPHDYSRTGYDKGHLKPNAVVDYSRVLQRETFRLSNVAPQAPGLNRVLWASIEKYGRNEVMRYKTLRVITGVCGNIGHIKGNVVIPEYWYKIYFLPNGGIVSFLSKNLNSVKEDKITQHFVSLRKIETTCKVLIIKKHKNTAP